MGLAEPRKRAKISHDPRNLNWSSSDSSFGQRHMQKHGWSAGEALGANRGLRAEDSEAAKVRISVKDDNLGLGASLKSKDLEHQRTGLDAFAGLLGRLNAKDDRERKEVEKKFEDRKLALWAQGRWGGMVFVPGGLLVQKNPADLVKEEENERRKKESKAGDEVVSEEEDEVSKDIRTRGDDSLRKVNVAASASFLTESEKDEATLKAERKAARRQLKEERRARKEAKRSRKAAMSAPVSTAVTDTEENLTSGVATPTSAPEDTKHSSATKEKLKNGRHILRGRNIQAKRAAFSDLKGLDEIFMRKP